jgi:hypothetical protein
VTEDIPVSSIEREIPYMHSHKAAVPAGDELRDERGYNLLLRALLRGRLSKLRKLLSIGAHSERIIGEGPRAAIAHDAGEALIAGRTVDQKLAAVEND